MANVSKVARTIIRRVEAGEDPETVIDDVLAPYLEWAMLVVSPTCDCAQCNEHRPLVLALNPTVPEPVLEPQPVVNEHSTDGRDIVQFRENPDYVH